MAIPCGIGRLWGERLRIFCVAHRGPGLLLLPALVGHYERTLFITERHALGNPAGINAQSSRAFLRDRRRSYANSFSPDGVRIDRGSSVGCRKTAIISPGAHGSVTRQLSRDLHGRNFIAIAGGPGGSNRGKKWIQEISSARVSLRDDYYLPVAFAPCRRALLPAGITHTVAFRAVRPEATRPRRTALQ